MVLAPAAPRAPGLFRSTARLASAPLEAWHCVMATGEDQRLTCVSCGEEFLFTVGEQEFYKERGLSHAPTRCKRCREQRKGQRPGAAGPPPRRAKPGGAAHGSAGRET